MATVSTPVRQPFGILNESKLRTLQSIKNRQNSIAPNSAPVKRRAPSPDLSDSENVDPTFFNANIKRKRAGIEDDVSQAKAFKPFNSVVQQSPLKSIATSHPASSTPRVEALQMPSATPSSAPPAAGRSPPRANRSLPRQRFVPPNMSSRSPSLSITAALKGTLSHKRLRPLDHSRKAQSTVEDLTPKSWFFDIFEESDDVQDYRMNEWTMTQSSAALEISDDEGKTSEKCDRGKENIDPNAMLTVDAPVTRSMAAAAAASAAEEALRVKSKDAMDVKEPRAALSDLNPADHYPEGLDATSVVLVHEDTAEEPVENDNKNPPVDAQDPIPPVELTTAPTFTFESPVDLVSLEPVPEWTQKQTLSSDDEQHTYKLADPDDLSLLKTSDDSADIQIWESESAKDASSPPRIADDEQGDDVSGFCLHEL